MRFTTQLFCSLTLFFNEAFTSEATRTVSRNKTSRIQTVSRTVCPLFAAVALVAALTLSTMAGAANPPKRYVSEEELRKLVGPDEFARLLREAERLATEAPVFVSREADTIRAKGPINAEMARLIEAELNLGGVTTLVIRSGGGYVESGISIGHLIADAGLTVVVDGYCVSSCANYIFTAASQRTIPPGAYVVWHGSPHQKDGREFERCGQTVSVFDGLPWLLEEIAEVRDDAAGIARRRQRHDLFFERIGVNEFITRAGQEPVFHGNFTMSVEAMARFGLTNVEAAPDYGTPAYCAAVNQKRPTLGLHCLEVTDRIIAYERARRALGEVCNSEGRLEIDTSGRERRTPGRNSATSR